MKELNPEINKIIVKLFLEKVELLSEKERKEILYSIHLLNNPLIITGTPVAPPIIH